GRSWARGRAKEAAQIAVAEAGRGPLATADGLQEGEVGRVADAEGADPPAAVGGGTADLVQEPMEGGAVLDGGERVQIVLVGALRAGLEAGGEFAGKVAVGLAPQEAHDVGALEVERGVADEGGVDGGEGRGGLEQDVGGPLALVDGPVVGLRPGLEDLGVEGVE